MVKISTTRIMDHEESTGHHAFTTLRLFGNLEECDEYILIPCLTTGSTSLTDFKTSGVGCFRIKNARNAKARLSIYVDSIYLRHSSGYGLDTEDAETLTRSKRMKFIDVYRYYNFRPQAVAPRLPPLRVMSHA